MLIQIHGNQVPQFWEVIKFAAIQSDDIKEEYQKVYLQNLLYDLLSGKKYCFFSKKENQISFIVIISFSFLEQEQIKYLCFNNIYSFFTQEDSVWQGVFVALSKIATEAECKAIIGNSNNERVHEICLSVGARCSSHTYEYYL